MHLLLVNIQGWLDSIGHPELTRDVFNLCMLNWLNGDLKQKVFGIWTKLLNFCGDFRAGFQDFL